MKFVNHQTTLHLSFKIKCCVDRLRPPPINGHIQSPSACLKRAKRRPNLSFAYRALVLTLWLPVGLEDHLELRHRLQVFEVKHFHQRQRSEERRVGKECRS